MKQEVTLSIQGRQTYQDQEPEIIELVTEGTLEKDGNAWCVSYEESDLTGLKGTNTTFRVEPGMITLTRKGPLNSQMVFQEGRRHLSLYNTPYGSMTIGVHTNHLMAELTDQGGDIEVDYAIEMDHAVAGRNIFRINVKEADSASLKQ